MTNTDWTCTTCHIVIPGFAGEYQTCHKCGAEYSREIDDESMNETSLELSHNETRLDISRGGWVVPETPDERTLAVKMASDFIGDVLIVAREQGDWQHYGYASFTEYLDQHYEQSRATLYRKIQIAEQSRAVGLPAGEYVTVRDAATLNQNPQIAQRVQELIAEGFDADKAVKQAQEEERDESRFQVSTDEEGRTYAEVPDEYDIIPPQEGGDSSEASSANDETQGQADKASILKEYAWKEADTSGVGAEVNLGDIQSAPETTEKFHVCLDCGSTNIGRKPIGIDTPDFVALLAMEVPRAHNITWDSRWSMQLSSWWKRLPKRDEVKAMEIARALVSHGKKYKNYNLTFQNWYGNDEEGEKPGQVRGPEWFKQEAERMEQE